ncbi:hypothetical protein HOL24_06660, partial [bacterium]|nr:hypothetical protein [bacterium]
NKKIDYVLLSEVIGKIKYKVLLSTAETYQEKVTFYSYFKYIYSISIGSTIERFRLSKFFVRIISHPLTGDGRYAKKFRKYPVERILGINTIKYPTGLDINKLAYPKRQWKDVFDIYLCHSVIDYNLIVEKFSEVKCIRIGYPKYENLPSVKYAKNIIYNDFKSIDKSKQLILWMPTIVGIKGEIIDNINVWLPIITRLLAKYNVLISVHPKLMVLNPEMTSYLAKLGFLVNMKKARNLSVLYQASDLVLCDYGASVLSAVYMKKKLILLNSPSEKYINWREERKYVDDDVRKEVSAFNLNDGVDLIKQINNDIKYNNISKRNSLKERYFGKDCEYKNTKEIFDKLIK